MATMTFDEYRQDVRDAILQRSGRTIFNATIDHAAVITQESFGNAQQSVRILSHRLDPDCYARESVRNSVRFFLADREHSAQILVESELWDKELNYQWDRHPLIRDMIEFTGGEDARLQLKRVPRHLTERYEYNFLILDDYGFRYEADRESSAAVARFLPSGSPMNEVVRLGKIFEDLWKKSQPLLAS